MMRTSTPFLVMLAISSIAFADEAKPGTGKISFSKQIEPILRANCVGCHQPAKPNGDFVLTSYERLFAGGENGKKLIVPSHPDKSFLVESITPDVKGQSYMPEKQKPLDAGDRDLIRKWIAEGAVDDTPVNARAKYDMDHPPIYSRQPVVSGLDFSPDGKLLAVTGFHEVLLWNADGTKLEGRLIGLAERIQALRFSPDGKRLAVAGGLPGRIGEIQVWNVEKRKLILSKAITFDTLYGVSWSPDGSKLAFGCADNTVRAIDAATGEQVLFQGSHSDWAVDTCFTNDGANVVSVSRDRTVKLTEVATQRFIDNITSITPGGLKGGLLCVARHPKREEIVIGGADGQPKVYRVHRVTARKIGDDANLVRELPAITGRVNSLAVSADGKRIAAVSSLDGKGQIRVFGYEFDPEMPPEIKKINEKVVNTRTAAEKAKMAEFLHNDIKSYANVENVNTALFAVAFRPDGRQIAVAGVDGMIRLVNPESGKTEKEFAAVTQLGTAVAEAKGDLKQIAARVTEKETSLAKVDFIQDVQPILSRMGCNSGTCHGSAQGKNGFKLSLRGYDPIFDVRALTDELASRRVNVASPDDSLMLLKITNAVPHVGGQVTKPGEPYYMTIRNWIAQGATIDLKVARVVGIEVTPRNPVIEKIGDVQQLKVIAQFADGKTRDVTKEAFLDSGSTETATVDRGAKMTAIRRGEAPVLARYEGSYAATTLTVMGDRTGFEWKEPATYNRIDELVAAKWQRLKIRPSELCNDAEFLRRVYLDLTGLPPTVEIVKQFLADGRDSKAKREELIDKLIGSPEYVEYWTNKWADLLQVNRKYLGAEGASDFRKWIRLEVEKNTPYNEFVAKILTANGSNKDNPPASYFKILREPTAMMENTTHLFLGVRFNCNKCHDHPFERWTQDQYYETAAYFARVELKADPKAGAAKIGGTAVEGAKPLYEIVAEAKEGEVKHDRTGLSAKPKFPYPAKTEQKAETRRDELSAWITSADNQYFARSLVNRLWGYTFGIGIIEPIDDTRAGNPPTNPELLDYLTKEFIRSNFNTRHIVKLIVSSRTYQLSIETNKWNEDDKINFSHASARRLPAEVLFDTLHRVTGAQSHFPGVKAGIRAAELPDSGVELPDGFLNNLGRPVRESACECERSSGLQLGPVMALINGRTIGDAIAQDNNALAQLIASEKDDRKVIQELFLRILNRPATAKEIDDTVGVWKEIDQDHAKMQKALAKYEADLAPRREKAEADRVTGLEKARRDLAQYERDLVPILKEREAQRAAKILHAEAAYEKFAQAFEEGLPALEKKKFKDQVEWVVLDPKTFKGVKDPVNLKKLDDKSIVAEKATAKTEYQVTAETDLKDISAIRLELLTSDKAPGKGPGFGGNGNFVLSQFEFSISIGGKELAKPMLKSAIADFQQDNFPATSAIDGQINGGKGWAIAPATGQGHWITFDLDKPISKEGMKTLSFNLIQRFTGTNHNIARFRISVAASPKPVGLSVSEEWKAILKTPADKRTPEQKAMALKYFSATDANYIKQKQAVAAARQPLAMDAKLKDMKDQVEILGRPLPPDAKLVQMKQDLETSAKQLANRRLTDVQDLAWALVNSPSFLFNR